MVVALDVIINFSAFFLDTEEFRGGWSKKKKHFAFLMLPCFWKHILQIPLFKIWDFLGTFIRKMSKYFLWKADLIWKCTAYMQLLDKTWVSYCCYFFLSCLGCDKHALLLNRLLKMLHIVISSISFFRLPWGWT